MNQAPLHQALLQKAQPSNIVSALSNSTNSNTSQRFDTATVNSHFIVSDDSLSESFELIKILRSHQHSGRWTVLIAPQNIPDKALLNCCSVDMGQVLVVHAKQTQDVLATVENALRQSTCSAVVAWCDQLPIERVKQINQVAAQSNCHFYGISRSNNWAG